MIKVFVFQTYNLFFFVRRTLQHLNTVKLYLNDLAVIKKDFSVFNSNIALKKISLSFFLYQCASPSLEVTRQKMKLYIIVSFSAHQQAVFETKCIDAVQFL